MFGLLILILVELFYLKDNMGDTYFRMSTRYSNATCQHGSSLGSLRFDGGYLAYPTGPCPAIPVKKSAAPAMVVMGFLFIVPFPIPLDLNYGGRSLDGLAISKSHPGDAGGVAYLND